MRWSRQSTPFCARSPTPTVASPPPSATSTGSPLRSAVKPLQALPLVASGAVDAMGVSDRELAIACGSHNGEPGHVEIVAEWLARLGLSEDHLQCGRARPMAGAWDVLAADDIVEPTRIKHNCSGKHTGFLTLALHLGVDPSCYLDETAPVQRTVLQSLADRFGLPGASLETAVDGCGAPVACVSARYAGTRPRHAPARHRREHAGPPRHQRPPLVHRRHRALRHEA